MEEANPAIVLPSQAQLALAFVIVKHKPPGIKIQQYLECLQSSVRSKCAAVSSQERGQHIDPTRLWKQAYDDLRVQQEDFHDQYDILVQENVKLRQQLATTADSPRTEKRKRALSNTPRKRARLESRMDSTADEVICEIESLKTSINRGASIIGRLFRVGHALSERTTAQDELGDSITHTCNAVIERLRDCSQSLSPTRGSRARPPHLSNAVWLETAETFTVAGKAMTICLKAMARFSTHDEHSERPVYSIVLLFSVILDALHTMVQSQPPQAEDISRVTRLQANMGRVVTKVVSPEKISATAAGVLASAIQNANTTNVVHETLMQGFISVLLEHIGKVLSLLTFGTNAAPEADKEGAVSQAPYLVFVLAKLVHCLSEPRDETAGDIPASLKSQYIAISGSAISTQLRIRLQHTLLRGVFGGNDSSFSEAIARPDLAVTDDESLKDVVGFQPNSPGWFVEKVWDLVGWQILAKEIGMDMGKGDLPETC